MKEAAACSGHIEECYCCSRRAVTATTSMYWWSQLKQGLLTASRKRLSGEEGRMVLEMPAKRHQRRQETGWLKKNKLIANAYGQAQVCGNCFLYDGCEKENRTRCLQWVACICCPYPEVLASSGCIATTASAPLTRAMEESWVVMKARQMQTVSHLRFMPQLQRLQHLHSFRGFIWTEYASKKHQSCDKVCGLNQLRDAHPHLPQMKSIKTANVLQLPPTLPQAWLSSIWSGSSSTSTSSMSAEVSGGLRQPKGSFHSKKLFFNLIHLTSSFYQFISWLLTSSNSTSKRMTEDPPSTPSCHVSPKR